MDLFMFIATFVKVFIVTQVLMVVFAYMTLVERKVSGYIQMRVGPNRVGPWGLFQPLADGLKFLMKEDIIPEHVHRPTYLAAPVIAFVMAMTAFAVVPFGSSITIMGREIPLVIADVDVGVLLSLAAASVGVYGIVLAGWSSNNNYSLIGGLRATAQMISYELSMGFAVLGVVVSAGTLNLNRIVEQQADGVWNVLVMPLGALIFLISAFAETNRLPFDLPEAEPELVAGYHVEYSSFKFSMFYIAEYIAMITGSALMVTLFLGGYAVPGFLVSALGLEGNVLAIVEIVTFGLKCGFFLFLFVWVRWTLPRFRYDQLMHIGWKVLLPLSIFNVVLVGVLVATGVIG